MQLRYTCKYSSDISGEGREGEGGEGEGGEGEGGEGGRRGKKGKGGGRREKRWRWKGEIDGRREGGKGEETTAGAQPFIRRSKVYSRFT